MRVTAVGEIGDRVQHLLEVAAVADGHLQFVLDRLAASTDLGDSPGQLR
nr:hypothetical protein [Nocardia gipuzkoensis]